jgi:hypothetical protein
VCCHSGISIAYVRVSSEDDERTLGGRIGLFVADAAPPPFVELKGRWGGGSSSFKELALQKNKEN